MSLLDRLLDPFRGAAITIPPYDGAWKPNAALDGAAQVAALPGAEILARDSAGRIWLAAGPGLHMLDGTSLRPAAPFAAPVSALAAWPSGGLAVALADGGLWHLDGEARQDLTGRLPRRIRATALLAEPDGGLVLAEGSARHAPPDWTRALMEKTRDGALWRLDPAGGEARQLAGGLAFPAGLARAEDGALVVAEAFAHRLAAIRPGARRPATVLDRIPGYPGRLSPSASGGHWLSVFAPRNRLVELVLREDRFRAEMVASIAPEHWIAPALRSGASFLEPLQRGGVRTMGMRKPWAPGRSYGLVARLDAGFQPVESFHSRADGRRHGATSVLDLGGARLVALAGADEIIRLEDERSPR